MERFLLILNFYSLGFITHLLRSEYGTFQLFSGDQKTKEGEMFIWGILSFIRGLWNVYLIIVLLTIRISWESV